MIDEAIPLTDDIETAILKLLEAWDMSADVLGPEWNALAEKIEDLRGAFSAEISKKKRGIPHTQ